MRSKLLHAGSLAALLGIASGCGLVRDQSPKVATLGMGSAEAACLAGSAELWREYFAGSADRARVDGFFQCAEDSIRLFTQRARGAREGQYSPDELRRFLETYFLNGYSIRDQLVREVMYLKQVTLGGTTDSLSASDLEQVIATLEILRRNARRLQPYMPLTPEHVAELPDEIFEDALGAIRRAAAEIGADIQKSGLPYSFDHLDALLHEIEYFYPGDFPHELRSRMSLIRLLKSAFFAPGADAIAPGQWTSVLGTGAEWYVLALRVARLKRRQTDWYSGEGRRGFVSIARAAAGLIRVGISRHEDGAIPFSTLDGIIDSLKDDELIKPALAGSRDVLKQFLRPLLTRALAGPEDDSQGRRAEGLTVGVIERIERSLTRWSGEQKLLEGAFLAAAAKAGITGEHALSTGFAAEELLTVLPSQEEDAAAGALRMMIASAPPLFEMGAPEVTIQRGAGERYSYRGLSYRIWVRELVRFMLEGYAQDPRRARSAAGVTQPEFHCFTDDVRRLGIALGIVDARKYDMHYKRFREARLFMFASNGDEYLNLPESEQLFEYLLSADRHTRRIHEEIPKRAAAEHRPCPLYGKDPFGFSRIDAECFRAEYFGNPQVTWKHLPELARYYLSLKPEQRIEFKWLLETSARAQGFSTEPMESSDTQGFALVAQYVETLFRRFDRNGDGFIDGKESHAAFLVFQGTLDQVVRSILTDPKEIQQMTQPENLEALFTYLLAHGEEPDTDSVSGKVGFWLWMERGPKWRFKADRMRVLRIFATLGSALSGATQPQDSQHSACWQD